MTAQKKSSIRNLLAHTHEQGRRWVIVDHWEADQSAIGIASHDRGCLVYISSYGKLAGEYDYECEVSVGPNPEDYEDGRNGQGCLTR
jgi:hypothetical protein